MNSMVTTSKEKLMAEVMLKDGKGSTSPFAEVEFENQRHRTQVKRKDLNPFWNEKLVFHIKDIVHRPYRTIEDNVFNKRRSSNSRNFLGKVRVSGSSIAKEGEEAPQLYTPDERSLFSHIRGEITLKLHVSTREKVKQVGSDNGMMVAALVSSSGSPKKKKMQQHSSALVVQQE